jgi:hypothetical protein
LEKRRQDAGINQRQHTGTFGELQTEKTAGTDFSVPADFLGNRVV